MIIWLQIVVGLMMASMGGNSIGSGDEDWSGPHQAMMRSIHVDVARNKQVLGRDHLSEPVALAMATVPRHEFVPEELRGNAYANHPLPIGHGQTISQPTIVALMTDLLALGPEDNVLEVGTGSGYQAAVLSEVVTRGRVFTIEIVSELARTARKRLANLGYKNVVVHTGDGYLGLPENAPFDGIMVTAAANEIPVPLIEQLKPGGRLVMPVGGQGETQWLTLVSKDLEGE
ncbi:MAG: protein-L-isoaspartate(D-aspartate) O-methyltransferase, partial [Candidatus Krumholzibacteria bacterium]|nr:protein-L-isoaspartate(D-aspartate) O-methyltransferase [Candidatus Krumholzibacteria bacterium]